ncbi:hypothetical protein FA13DRAFT_1741673 [Coprinellus micaceus]|uniref:Uncharacterized protein n=1 Tax=Coprinellus micaceus TaxID=71717 RepID=A0A4Y7SKF9_COPMI|nr:hypothetical protein FA13DRAFT_1741673 [Coprinellus micaceus]
MVARRYTQSVPICHSSRLWSRSVSIVFAPGVDLAEGFRFFRWNLCFGLPVGTSRDAAPHSLSNGAVPPVGASPTYALTPFWVYSMVQGSSSWRPAVTVLTRNRPVHIVVRAVVHWVLARSPFALPWTSRRLCPPISL